MARSRYGAEAALAEGWNAFADGDYLAAEIIAQEFLRITRDPSMRENAQDLLRKARAAQ